MCCKQTNYQQQAQKFSKEELFSRPVFKEQTRFCVSLNPFNFRKKKISTFFQYILQSLPPHLPPHPSLEIMQVAACFGPAIRVIQAVVVDYVTGPFAGSAGHRRTCSHACKQEAQQISFHRQSREYTWCVQGWRCRR
jgi:hypothetical protein